MLKCKYNEKMYKKNGEWNRFYYSNCGLDFIIFLFSFSRKLKLSCIIDCYFLETHRDNTSSSDFYFD